MSDHYNKRPSEMIGISNDYEAYMFDEVCRYYQHTALQDDGTYKFSKIKWVDRSVDQIQQGNKDMMAHIQSQNKVKQ